MTRSSLLRFLCLTLFAAGAWAQRVQNMEIYFMGGPASVKSQVIGGTDVTLSSSTGYGTTTGYAYQVMRKSAAGLWVEFIPLVNVQPSAQTATIHGSISLGELMFVPAVRLMFPIQSRISVFGAVGGGWGFFNTPTLTSDNPPDLSTNNVAHGVIEAGGGVDFRLFQMISIRVDVRDFVTGRDLGGVAGRNHLLPMMGFVFHF